MWRIFIRACGVLNVTSNVSSLTLLEEDFDYNLCLEVMFKFTLEGFYSFSYLNFKEPSPTLQATAVAARVYNLKNYNEKN